MKIEILAQFVSNAHGLFRRGAVVDWPEEDARPLVDAGAAKEVTGKPAKPAKES